MYEKFPTDCGHPAYEKKSFNGKAFNPADLSVLARNVGKPSREACGACHFYGGGGDGVKHGDLNSLLVHPEKAIDVHMSSELNYQCSSCHTTKEHVIAGRYYTIPADNDHKCALPDDDGNRMGCESCHGARPHNGDDTLNDHTNKVSCQACHIPMIGRGGKATLTGWDWSTAGQFDENHNFIAKKDDAGNPVYHTKKGDLEWSISFIPDYQWYTGEMKYHRPSQSLDDTNPLELNSPVGSYDTEGSKIFPFKVLHGKQIYDTKYKTLVAPKLFGKKGTGAYWADFDWEKAAEAGMAETGMPFSGEIGFIETQSYWPVTHMVAPKEESLKCDACHSPQGRLANLSGFYLPGRDSSPILDSLGWIILLLSLIAVAVHGGVRIIFTILRRKNS